MRLSSTIRSNAISHHYIFTWCVRTQAFSAPVWCRDVLALKTRDTKGAPCTPRNIRRGDKYHRKSVGRKGADMYEHSLSQTRRRNSFLQMSPSHGVLDNSIILHSVQLSNIWPRAPLAACMRFAFRCRKVWNHVHFDTIVRRVSWALYSSIVEHHSKPAGLICNPFV